MEPIRARPVVPGGIRLCGYGVRHAWRVAARARALLMVATLCLGCGSTVDPARDIAAATVPPGIAMPSISDITATPHSRRYSWEFETPLEWAAYCDWVTNRFDHRLRLRGRNGSSIVFTGLGEGDAFHLEIQQVHRGPVTMQVRAFLTTSPD